MTIKHVLCTTALGLVLATSASAETPAKAWTDLNLRAGPSTAYTILSVIPAAQTVLVDGCLAQSNWCRVTYGANSGWASGEYLTSMVESPISANRERLAVRTITYEKGTDATVGGGVAGAVAGGIVGGPVGVVVGAVLGASVGAAATPTETVTTYVRSNPTAPVYLDGEVVLGAGIPETVTLAEVPESPFYYGSINGDTVLIERETRRVVYILR